VDLRTWLAFAAMELVLCLTPGPAVLTVFSSALEGGWRGGMASTFGILSGNAFYFLVSAAGLGAVLLASPRIFAALQWVGAAYLVALGMRMLFHAHRPPASAAVAPPPGTRFFARAVSVQLANPKALVFFGALLPQFMDPDSNLMRQFWILGVTGAALELGVLAGYTRLAVEGARRYPGGRFASAARRVAGGWMALLGAGLALARWR